MDKYDYLHELKLMELYAEKELKEAECPDVGTCLTDYLKAKEEYLLRSREL